MLKRQGALSKIQGQSFAGQKVRTENPEGVLEGMNEGKPSAGTLKRELENDNKILKSRFENERGDDEESEFFDEENKGRIEDDYDNFVARENFDENYENFDENYGHNYGRKFNQSVNASYSSQRNDRENERHNERHNERSFSDIHAKSRLTQSFTAPSKYECKSVVEVRSRT